MLNTFPIIEEDEEDEEGHLQSSVKSCHSDTNIPVRRHCNIPKVSSRSKSASVRSNRSSSASQGSPNNVQSSKLDVGVGVYMVLDRLTTGHLFVSINVNSQEHIEEGGYRVHVPPLSKQNKFKIKDVSTSPPYHHALP